MRVAIIGTAGRGRQGRQLNSVLYGLALNHVRDLLKPFEGAIATLVSGGAAWMDHIAVDLFMDGQIDADLELNFPCPWDYDRRQFVDTGQINWITNPGGTANFYHLQFGTRMGSPRSTLNDIHTALTDRGASHNVYEGMHARNGSVAQSDWVIALTWGAGEPPPGGTAHTWELAKRKRRMHISLTRFL